jgi:hypothetical protein
MPPTGVHSPPAWPTGVSVPPNRLRSANIPTAMSSGWPMRPSGMSATLSWASLASTVASILGVGSTGEGAADQLKAIEMLLDRGFGRSPQQLDIAHSVTDRPLQHLSDETLSLLVESAKGLEEGSGVVIDEDGQVVAG